MSDPALRLLALTQISRQWAANDLPACTAWLVHDASLPSAERLVLCEQVFTTLATLAPDQALLWHGTLPRALRDLVNPDATTFHQQLCAQGTDVAGNTLAELPSSPFALALVEEQTARLMAQDIGQAQRWAESLPSLHARTTAAQVIMLLLSEASPATALAYRESGLPREMYEATGGTD